MIQQFHHEAILNYEVEEQKQTFNDPKVKKHNEEELHLIPNLL